MVNSGTDESNWTVRDKKDSEDESFNSYYNKYGIGHECSVILPFFRYDSNYK